MGRLGRHSGGWRVRTVTMWRIAGACVAVLMIVVSVVVGVRQTRVLGQGPTNVAGEVDPGQCASCHQTIAGSKDPNLIFNHGFHLLVACADCHTRYPHLPDRTLKPTMASCFNCHGLTHGPRGLIAAATCETCHPKRFAKRPRSHVAAWAKAPHATAAKTGSNQCALCHQQSFCQACHERARVDVGAYVLGPYQPILETPVLGPPRYVDPESTVTAGQCTPCHKDFDRFMVRGFEKGRLIFDHEAHVSRGFKCTVCHPRFPHRPDGIDRPPMRTCYDCHGVRHGKKGLVAGTDCGLCHPKGFDLKPGDHTPQIKWLLSHGPPAKADLGYCYMCHQAGYCVPCHTGKTTLPPPVKKVVDERARALRRVGVTGEATRMASRGIIPKDHLSQQWRTRHGKEFMKLSGQCSPCHNSAFCNECHRTGMPHPPDWAEKHSAKGVGRDDCNVCHTDRSTCQSCHHGAIAGARLEAKNCVKCHPEVRLPWQDIRSKGMIVHAVHWKEKYRCLQCHIGFQPELRSVDRAHNYSFDLCRECHGALDRNRVMIAKPPVGVDLCRRCHPKMLL